MVVHTTTHQDLPSSVVLNVTLTRSIGDDASQKDLLLAMLMSTSDGTGNIKADWQKVGKIMTSLGYNFTISAMCKSSCLDTHTCGFLPFHT